MALQPAQFRGSLMAAIMADDAERAKVENPQPGQRIYRGEVRSYDRSMGNPGDLRGMAVRQALSHRAVSGRPVPTIGKHWTTNPSTPAEFSGTSSIRPASDTNWGKVHVQWEGVLDKPDLQVENRGGQYGAGHWERELRLKDQVPVRVTGAKYYVADKPEDEGKDLFSNSPRWRHVDFVNPRFPAVTSGSGIKADVQQWAQHAQKLGAPEELVQRSLREHEYWAKR